MKSDNKNLYKVYNIWKDLETSYSNRPNKDVVKTRKDYLYLITGFIEKERRTRLDYIKSRLTEELDSYTDEELKIYTELLEVFAGVDNILKTESVESVDSFERFILAAKNFSVSFKAVSHKLNDNFFDDLQPVRLSFKEANIKHNLMDIYEMEDCLGDNISIDTNGNIFSRIPTQSDDYYIMNSIASATHIYNIINKDTPDFYFGVLELGMHLFRDTKIKSNVLFLSNKYFIIDNNIATIKLGTKEISVKITPKCIYEENNSIGYFVPIDNKYGRIKIMLVEIKNV